MTPHAPRHGVWRAYRNSDSDDVEAKGKPPASLLGMLDRGMEGDWAPMDDGDSDFQGEVGGGMLLRPVKRGGFFFAQDAEFCLKFFFSLSQLHPATRFGSVGCQLESRFCSFAVTHRWEGASWEGGKPQKTTP